MNKIHYQTDHPEVIRESGYAFQYLDFGRMTKSASEAIPRDVLENFRPDDRHFGIHVIAMGSDESVGFNRNGDSFPEASLKEYHPTFVKHGHFYREHVNRDPKTQGIGLIKHSAYNNRMNRVELIVHGDKEKAEEEYELAKAGKELSFSMSVRLPHDECSCCMKKSGSLADYCDHLKYSLGRYVPSFRKYAHAINRENLRFYDISRVGRPADRIARYINYMMDSGQMSKAASVENLVVPGAAWAEFEGLVLPEDQAPDFTPVERAMLAKLAAAEKRFEEDPDYQAAALSMVPDHQFSQDQLNRMASCDVPGMLGELIKRAGAVLNFNDFASIITGLPRDHLVKSSSCPLLLPLDMFRRMMEDPFGCSGVEKMVSPCEVGCTGSSDGDAVADIFQQAAESLGLEDGKVHHRAMVRPAKNLTVILVKKAAERQPSAFMKALEQAYGVYLVKAATQIAKKPNHTLLPPALVGVKTNYC